MITHAADDMQDLYISVPEHLAVVALLIRAAGGRLEISRQHMQDGIEAGWGIRKSYNADTDTTVFELVRCTTDA